MMDERFRKTVYLEAHAVNEIGEAPEYAKWEMTAKDVTRIRSLRKLCEFHELSECRVWRVIDWDKDEELRLRDYELVVTPQFFWFTAHPKHADYDVETYFMDFDQLDDLAASNPSEVAYHESCDGAVREIVEESVDADEE